MSELQSLAATALRGTARAALPDPGPSPLGRVLAQVNRATPEETLLARAALAGLHAAAGQTPGKPSAPAPRFVPSEPPVPPAPPAFVALLGPLVQQPELLPEALLLLAGTAFRLRAEAALPLLSLDVQGTSLPLWPVLDEHARWLVRLNPDWRRHDLDTPAPSVRLRRLRRAWTEAHAEDPAGTAQALQAEWTTLKADERRAALEALAFTPHPADVPLLELARQDRVADIRFQAEALGVNLPGPTADAFRAALRSRLSRSRKGVLKLVDGGSVNAPVGSPWEDLDTARLLPMTSIEKAAAWLEVAPGELIGAMQRTGTGGAGHWGWMVALRQSLSHFGASLDTLLQVQDEYADLRGWPARLLHGTLREASNRLLGQEEPDPALLRVTLRLLWACGELSLLSGDEWEEPLQKLWTHLLGRVAPDDEAAFLYLGALKGLVRHVSPWTPPPTLPPPPPLHVPEKLTAQELERRQGIHERLEHETQATQAHLTHILALRRRMRETLSLPDSQGEPS